jgi:hypothetical protein
MAPPADPSNSSPRIWAIDLAVCAGVGALLGVLGPFGSYYNQGFLARIGYWTGAFVATGLTAGLVLRWVAPWARRLHIPIWAWLPATVAVISAPFAVVTRTAAIAIWPDIARHVSLMEWYAQGLLVTLIASSVFAALRLRRPAADDGAAPSEPAFLDRLPPRSRDLICLQMEDHYVRVHTAEGSVLVLIPLKQAIAELDGVEGVRVHRSWWVARRAVAGVTADSRNVKLKLTNGIEAPVARANVARLRALGWID